MGRASLKPELTETTQEMGLATISQTWHAIGILLLLYIWFQRKRTYTHFLICCPIFVKFTFLVMYSFKVGCVHGANFWLNIIQNAAATQHSNMVTNLEVQHTEGLGMELAIHEFSENWTHTEIMAPQQSPNEQNYSCQRSQLCKCWCPKIKSYTLKTKIHQKNIYQFKTIYARRCQTKKSSLDKSKCEKRYCLLPTLRSILLLWNLTFGSVPKSPGWIRAFWENRRITPQFREVWKKNERPFLIVGFYY